MNFFKVLMISINSNSFFFVIQKFSQSSFKVLIKKNLKGKFYSNFEILINENIASIRDLIY
jgi:hypothetical protein